MKRHASAPGGAPVVVGLDLSLTRTGMTAVPFGWGADWRRVTVAVAGEKLPHAAGVEAQVARLYVIRDAVLEFCERARATHVAVLGYAFSRQHTRAYALGELGGVVKLALVESRRYSVEVVVESRARTLLGTAPKRDVKSWAIGKLMEAGAPSEWPEDCLDAFVAANHVMSERGGDAVVLR